MSKRPDRTWPPPADNPDEEPVEPWDPEPPDEYDDDDDGGWVS